MIHPAPGLFLILAPPALQAPVQEVPLEFRLTANYLVTLPMFVEFPAQPQAGAPFILGLMGETPLGPLLESMKGRAIKNRPLAIRSVKEVDQMAGCHVLFIASSERYRLQILLPEARRRGILTISDMRDFVRLGGMVGLLAVNNRITYNLNQTEARNASLSFGTQLLKLANDVSR